MKKKLTLLILSMFILSSLIGCVSVDNKTPITVVTPISSSVIDIYGAPEAYFVVPSIFETLATYGVNGEIVPVLAESWVISTDKKTITFKIREGVKFHNGDPLTADDVIYSLDKFSKSPNGAALPFFVKSYKKIDDFTIEIVKNDAYGLIWTMLTAVHIIPKDIYETNADFIKSPIGTGAYKFVSMSSGQSITLAANTEYWGEEPKIKNVIVKTIANPATQIIALQTGEVDFIPTVVASDVKTIKKITTVELSTSLTDIQYTLELLKGGLIDNVKIREAIYHAVNPETVLITAGDSFGVVATEICPETSMNGFYKKVSSTKAYDPALSRKLLKEANYDSSKPLMISCTAPLQMKMAQSIQGDLNAVGIDVKIELLDGSAFGSKYVTGGIQMFIGGVGSAQFDIYQLVKWFSASGDLYNIWTGKTTEYNELVTKILNEMDESAQEPMILKALEMVKNNYYLVSLFTANAACAYNKKLSPIKLSVSGAVSPMKNWTFR